ncbi:hypothetical protein AgCh_015148 [Apium graveolens]
MANMKTLVILGLVLVISVVANAVTDDHDDTFASMKYDRRGLGQQASSGGGAAPASGGVIDITKVGAKGDGSFDNTEVIMKAWTDACHSGSKILIPTGIFLAGLLEFKGPCTGQPVIIDLQGTLKAKPDSASYPQGNQIHFYLAPFQISGGGTIDGNGEAAQAQRKKSGGKNLPDSLAVDQCPNSCITGVKFVNAKGFNIKIVESDNFKIDGLSITCGGDTLNTDGIHIARSKGSSITNCNIQTGDDCISIGDATTDLTVKNIQCGPGHGISIGSLGRFPDEKDVRNVIVNNVTLTGTLFGVRIKSFHNSPVLQAANITFSDITCKDVWAPIVIDQNYNMGSATQTAGVSKVKINGVTYKNIKGTTTSNNAISLNCSSGAPCEGVTLDGVSLTYSGNDTVDKELRTVCENAKATFTGTSLPPCKS